MDAQHRHLLDRDYLHHRRTLAAALLAVFVGASGAVAAQDTLSVEVTPLRVEARLKPGASHTQAVTLKNDGPKAVRIRARADDWYLSLDGTPQFKLASPGEPYSADGWVRLNPPEQVLEPGATGIVRFTATAPAGAKEASYRCAVMFEFERPDADPAAKNREVMFRGRVATVLYATVGSPMAAVEMTDLEGRVLPNRAPEVVATLANTGRRARAHPGVGRPSTTPPERRSCSLTGSGRTGVAGERAGAFDYRRAPRASARSRQARIASRSSWILGLRELLVGETTLEIPKG